MIAWAFEALIGSSLLMALVLVLRASVRRAFGPRIAYALWALPALRMVLPPLPGGWRLSEWLAPTWQGMADTPVAGGIVNPVGVAPEMLRHAVARITITTQGAPVEAAFVPPSVVPGGPSLIVLIAGVWLTGAVLFLLWQLVRHSLFCHRLMRGARSVRTIVAGHVRLIRAEGATGPMAFGIWRKYVAFPSDFEDRYDEQERALALAHELGHHARGDLIANWVALIVLAIHWFNPLAWRAFRAFRADQEMACDALVLAGRPEALRHAYGRAIVKSAHGGAVSAACHLHTINELKGRLKMLTNHKKTPHGRAIAGKAGVTGLILAGLALTASGTAAAGVIRVKVEQATGVDLAKVALPALPAVTSHMVARQADVPPPAPVPSPGAIPAPAPVPSPDAVAPPPPPVETGKQIVVIAKDKKVKGGADLDIVSDDCGKGKDATSQQIWTDKDGKKHQRIRICVDRIQTMAMDAAGKAAAASQMDEKAIEKAALASALGSLHQVKASIAAAKDMDETQRTAALEGIDSAIKELEEEMAGKGDRDDN